MLTLYVTCTDPVLGVRYCGSGSHTSSLILTKIPERKTSWCMDEEMHLRESGLHIYGDAGTLGST